MWKTIKHSALAILLTLGAVVGIMPIRAQTWNSGNYGGVHRSSTITYISPTGTAGTDATAMTIKTIVLKATTLTQVGDRMRIRSYFAATAGAAAVGTTKLNGVTCADTSVGGTSLALTECWLHYIDNTHANIIENEAGALGGVSAVNVAGFTWASDQNIIFTQDNVVNQHLVVYAMIVDIFPKGTIAP